MTVVMRIQRALIGTPSTPLQSREDSRSVATIDRDAITFHPELMIRWDDEADYVTQAECARSGRIGSRPARR